MAVKGTNAHLVLRYRRALREISAVDPNYVPAKVLKEWAMLALEPDNCEECYGAKGGVKGNENLVNGRVLCDYCTAKVIT